MQCDFYRVFGAGYPSLATMTVNEWYEQHQKYNTSDHGIAQTSGTMGKSKVFILLLIFYSIAFKFTLSVDVNLHQ